MASAINSDNGVVSGTAGLKSSADSSGVLDLQTNGTTAISISASQVVSFANQPTYTGGTANGVMYLNGSKAVTTGTDLTFDGAILGVNGVSVGRGAGAVATNTAVGASALAANTTGASNTAVGQNALLANTDGTQNTAAGRASLTANTSGVLNSGFGRSSLLANTTGSYNTAVGGSALASNTTASNNTAVGYQAGYSNTTGDYNTFIGRRAGYGVTTGTNNTIIGIDAGYSLTTGSYNTFVGSNAALYSSGQLITTGSKNTILGPFSGNQGGLDIRTSSGYVVLSDGDGNPVFKAQNNASWALQGAGVVGGIGITFPATQVASSDANTLDDYEEGAWTPALSGAGSPTYTENFGRYIKVGRLVTLTGKLAVTGATSSGNVITITGLPFAVADASDGGQRACSFISGDVQQMGIYVASAAFRTATSTMEGVRDNGSGSTVYWVYSELSSTSYEFSINVTYMATA